MLLIVPHAKWSNVRTERNNVSATLAKCAVVDKMSSNTSLRLVTFPFFFLLSHVVMRADRIINNLCSHKTQLIFGPAGVGIVLQCTTMNCRSVCLSVCFPFPFPHTK